MYQASVDVYGTVGLETKKREIFARLIKALNVKISPFSRFYAEERVPLAVVGHSYWSVCLVAAAAEAVDLNYCLCWRDWDCCSTSTRVLWVARPLRTVVLLAKT